MAALHQTPTWIFGYGSLMWNPGFPFIARQPARLQGYQRRPCVSSVHYRGSLTHPGVVMGLDKGGACQGIGYQIAPANYQHVIEYLDQRELIYPVYQRLQLPIDLLDGSEKSVPAITYVVDRQDALYIGDLPPPALLARVATAAGVSGTSLAYLSNVLEHLRDLDIHDAGLEDLLRAVQALPPAPHLPAADCG
jgi:cation transport protein ChaC